MQCNVTVIQSMEERKWKWFPSAERNQREAIFNPLHVPGLMQLCVCNSREVQRGMSGHIHFLGIYQVKSIRGSRNSIKSLHINVIVYLNANSDLLLIVDYSITE